MLNVYSLDELTVMLWLGALVVGLVSLAAPAAYALYRPGVWVCDETGANAQWLGADDLAYLSVGHTFWAFANKSGTHREFRLVHIDKVCSDGRVVVRPMGEATLYPQGTDSYKVWPRDLSTNRPREEVRVALPPKLPAITSRR